MTDKRIIFVTDMKNRYEDESNVEYRKEFIENYLKYKKRTYRWVHVEEHVAIKLRILVLNLKETMKNFVSIMLILT